MKHTKRCPRVVRSVVLLIFFLTTVVLLSFSQTEPRKFRSLLDVSKGMSKGQVLTGLADGFNLQREEMGDSPLEAWSAVPKKTTDQLSAGEIVFEMGKVAVVRVSVMPNLGGDAVALARELFFMIQAHAKPPEPVTKAESALNVKDANIPVEVQSWPAPNGDTQMIRFYLDDMQLEINIRRGTNQPDAVWVVTIH
jgi:hypothetical protein